MKLSFNAAVIVNFATVLAATIATRNTVAIVSDKLPSSKYFRHPYHRRYLDEDINMEDELNNLFDVTGSCLFFAGQNSLYNNSNNKNQESFFSCAEFHGDAWNYNKMVEYCTRKPNSTLTIDEECPSEHYSSSSKLELIAGWCYLEITEGNGTMIEATPMLITTPTTSNCSGNKNECEIVIGGIFKTSATCYIGM